MKFKKEIEALETTRTTLVTPPSGEEANRWDAHVKNMARLVIANMERTFCEVDIDYDTGWRAGTDGGPHWSVIARSVVEVGDDAQVRRRPPARSSGCGRLLLPQRPQRKSRLKT